MNPFIRKVPLPKGAFLINPIKYTFVIHVFCFSYSGSAGLPAYYAPLFVGKKKFKFEVIKRYIIS